MSACFSERLTPDPAVRFVLEAAAWNLVLFGLLRLPWTAVHLLWPLVEFQQALLATMGFSASRLFVSLECSGADVMALCAAVLLAYPVAWRSRVIGAAGGITLVLLTNSIRIGVLGRFAASASFPLLHLYVLPAVLILVASAYVFAWMRWTGRRGADSGERRRLTPRARFFWCAGSSLAIYVAITPWLLTSTLVSRAASGVAYAAALVLRAAGVDSTASGGFLSCHGIAYVVTPECILSPLLPLLLAAAVSVSISAVLRVGLVFAAVAVFAAVNVGRLLVLALPSSVVGDPMFVVHGYRQLLVGAVAVAVAAWTCDPSVRPSPIRAARLAFLATLSALAIALTLGPPVVGLLTWVTHGVALTRPHDEQGVLALLPAYQMGLLAALLIASRVRLRVGILAMAAVVASQAGFFVGLRVLAVRAGLLASATPVRAWAVAIPLVLAVVATRVSRIGDGSYRAFWQDVGERFPDLAGAASTEYYRQNEQRLFAENLPIVAGARLFKTDLWDEAKNTRILQWAQQCGARVYGVDISEPTVRQARAAFGHAPLGAAVGDVRRLPFGDRTFDALYSMGTIEHFLDFEVAVAEIFRVMRPGGRAIVGVPNRLDPFLRPLLVSVLSALGLYDYGYERSFSRRALRKLLERAGFEVVAETAILFIPGWLRMLDLWCYTRWRPLSGLTGAVVTVFRWIDRVVPAVRRHGYLLATVVIRPVTSATTPRR